MSNGTAAKVLPPSKLAHVVLKTHQFQPLVDFYTTFLGAHVVHQNPILAFLTYDDEHHRIAIAGLPGIVPRVPNAAGLVHIAFTFDNLPDLLTAYEQRKAHGITPHWCVNHGPTMSMYYRDPDGNEIETQVDTFDTPEEATAFMETAEFAENPFGVDFVPEEIAKRLAAGESEKSIFKRANIGPRDISSIPIEL